ncbi:holin [Streptomyces scabiei]|uniref:holin n=1 Tax=Streptomyces scabiei TaxID=1930 RepID=UPI0029BAE62F|nr:holin [Streptomyces scabiei]MDX2538573.1 holin [Streptomyces scabiei]MDX2799847.1 holin [Streptomyces scabiei]MDX2855528.1 holin [Streptomyces scabiei]MDX3278074.1 holin [Streptomyces scabiei]MDX3828502.1 holin [Streptomyces scabiei]
MASASAPIETKVKVSSVFTYLASVAGLAILGAVTGDPSLISGMPDVLEPFVLALIPAATAAISGWAAPHTPRADG